MPIDHKDFMHGAALVAIADSNDFTALNKASVKYGHYVVNHNRHLFLKYNDGSGPGDYHFTYTAADKARIIDANGDLTFAVLVCGDEVIAGISRAELSELVDLEVETTEAITVRAEQRRRLRIYSSRAELPLTPRSAFPESVLS